MKEAVLVVTRQRRTRLWEWRVANDYTLEEIGDLTGLTKSYLSKVERGLRHVHPETKKRMARNLGASIADLFEAEAVAEAS